MGRLAPKSAARKPTPKTETYLKYGFVITEHDVHLCPRCGKTLNAGTNYQPKYCDQCGQRVDFAGTEWKEDRKLGFAKEEKRGDA